jgi:hypothetical protein
MTLLTLLAPIEPPLSTTPSPYLPTSLIDNIPADKTDSYVVDYSFVDEPSSLTLDVII